MTNEELSAPPEAPRRGGRRPVITEQVVIAIAELVGKKRLTEPEACAKLGIKLETWKSWKSKGKRNPRFSTLILRVQAETIATTMDRVEVAGLRDWRADAARLAWIDRDRFGVQRPEAPQTTVTVNVLALDRIQSLTEMVRKELSGQQPTKSLPETIEVSTS